MTAIWQDTRFAVLPFRQCRRLSKGRARITLVLGSNAASEIHLVGNAALFRDPPCRSSAC